jgi:endonuclease/exonuclease/phosphatase family metal-dependent hydrolase
MTELDEPFVVAGDFNQRYPRTKYGNRAAAEAMENTFVRVDIVTSGTLAGCDKPGIDHIAISKELAAAEVEGWRGDVTGNRLSDHDGAFADLVLR